MARLKKDDPRIYRLHESIRVIVPKRLIRVGYENDVRDVKTKVLNALCNIRKKGEEEIVKDGSENEVRRMEIGLGLVRRFKGGEITPRDEFNEWFCDLERIVERNFNCQIFDYRDKFINKVVDTIAYEIVKERMRTANKTRKKFEEEMLELKDRVFRIKKIQYRKIGYLVPVSTGSYEYEPGYLQDEKTIKVLSLIEYEPGYLQDEKTIIDIDATYVEKIVQYEHMKDVPGWIKRYYNVLSISQRYDAFKFLLTTGLQDIWFRNRELEIQQSVLQKAW